MILYGHPFSSYTWKAQIAFYEKEVAHEFRAIETAPPFTNYDELRAHWPVGQFPLIVDDGRPLFEASIIAEYLDQRSDAGPRLIPADPRAALEVRFLCSPRTADARHRRSAGTARPANAPAVRHNG